MLEYSNYEINFRLYTEKMKAGKNDLLDYFRREIMNEIKKYPTTEKFCFENGIDKSVISRLLSGKQADFQTSTLDKIADALGKKIELRLMPR